MYLRFFYNDSLTTKSVYTRRLSMNVNNFMGLLSQGKTMLGERIIIWIYVFFSIYLARLHFGRSENTNLIQGRLQKVKEEIEELWEL